VVSFVPGGLAGFVSLHAPLLRARRLAPVARAYALGVIPLATLTLGAVLLVEMAYRRSTQPEAGTRMRLLGMALDTAQPWPWIASGALLLAGAWMLHRGWPRVAAAWQSASAPEDAPSPAGPR
jgi:hypothetical protein